MAIELQRSRCWTPQLTMLVIDARGHPLQRSRCRLPEASPPGLKHMCKHKHLTTKDQALTLLLPP